MNRREFLGGLAAVSLARAQQRPAGMEAAIKLEHGRPTLYLNGAPTPPVIYALGHCPGYRWTWEERSSYSISEFARAGVRLFQADIHLQQMWPSPDHFDIELARKQIRGFLDACPDAAVMLRLHVNSPPWWNQAHPEECVQWAGKSFEKERPWGMTVSMDTDLMRVPRHSMASRRWLDECGAKTRELLQKLAATPEGAALFSIQVAAGVFGEWHYYGFTENEPDVGPAMTARFREWLKAKYGQTLPYEASVPGIQERMRADGYLRDPKRDRRVIDYLHCQHEAVTDAFIHFCRAVKESWPRPILTAGFHGCWFTMFGRMGAGGHLAVRRALESPYVDALCAPQSYENMRSGEPGISRGVIDSARLHGKLWLDEMDTEPAVWDPTVPKAEAPARSISYLRSNVLAPLTRGMGLWYYDLVCEEDYSPDHRAAGLWDTRPMQAEITKIEKLRKERYSQPYSTPADVLVVFDTESFYYSGNNVEIDPVSTELLNNTTGDLYRSGAAFHLVYFFDLEKIDLSRYKAVVFGNVFYLDAARREVIASRVAREGRHLIWSCAAGYIGDEGVSAGGVARAVGMKIAPVRAPLARVVIKSGTAPAGTFGFNRKVEPLFAVQDPDATALGVIEGSDSVGLARKKFEHHTAWYASVPLRGHELLRYILREAGAHIYSDGGDVVHVGNGILCVETAEGGPRTLRLRNGKQIKLDLPANSTTVLDAETGERQL